MSSTTSILVLFSLGGFLLHMLVNSRYGFPRDELLTTNNARRLAWGYVIHPPLTAFVGRVELELFGTSLRGFRLFVARSGDSLHFSRDLPPAHSAANARHSLRQLWQWPFKVPRCSRAH